MESNFDDNFFTYYENFEQVPSSDYDTTPLVTELSLENCPLCNRKFGSLFHKPISCHNCHISFCKDCIKRNQNMDLCLLCHSILNDPNSFSGLDNLLEYKKKMLQNVNAHSPKQTSLIVLLDWLKTPNVNLHEYAIRSLYSKRNKYINDMVIVKAITDNMFKHLSLCINCPRRELILDLLADFFIVYKKRIPLVQLKYEDLAKYLDPTYPNISAAAARLIFVGAANNFFSGDQETSINFLGHGSKRAIAYTLASIATAVPDPPLFDESTVSHNLVQSHIPKLVESIIMDVFEDKRKVTSIASQYFGSIILLKISETSFGLNELIKFLPLVRLIETAQKLCPRQLGMSKHNGRISVFLTRTLKHVLFYCEKSPSRDLHMNIFIPALIGLIFDFIEHHIGYSKYSYFCIVQTIAIEIAEEIQAQDQYNAMLSSQQIKEKLHKLKEERITSEQRENQSKISFLSNQNQEMQQLTQEQLLQLRERERESQRIINEFNDLRAKYNQKVTEVQRLTNMFESQKNDFNNKMAQANNAVTQRDITIKNLNGQIAQKQAEINNANEIINARNVEILQLRTTNSNQSGASQELIQAKESEIAIHKKNAEEKTKLLEDKQHEIEELTQRLSTIEQEKNSANETAGRELENFKLQLQEKQDEIQARDTEITRIQALLKEKDNNLIEMEQNFKNQIAVSTTEVEQMRTKISQIEESKSNADQEIEKMRSELQNTTNDSSAMIQSVKMELETKNTEIASLKEETEKLQNDITLKEQLISILKQKADGTEGLNAALSEKDSEISSLKQQLEASNSNNSNKDEEIAKMKKAIEEKSNEISSKDSKISELENEINTLKHNNDSSSAAKDSEIESLKQKLDEETKLLTEKSQQIESKSAELQQKEQDILNKDSQVKQLSSKFAEVLGKWTETAQFITKDSNDLDLESLIAIPPE